MKLFMIPLLAKKLDANKDPKILFSLDPLNDFENSMELLKSLGKIDEDIINGLHGFEITPIMHCL
jgi:hypothetical protein